VVRGVAVDGATRCAHYRTDRDVVAIRFACCDAFYACFDCHATVTDHDAGRLPADRLDEPSVRCGACGTVHAARTYLQVLGVGTATRGDRAVDGDPASGPVGERPDPDPESESESNSNPDPRCPACDAGWNPGCAGHADRYFAI
jgi:uncharacterized CHY-type Zn-finger protein